LTISLDNVAAFCSVIYIELLYGKHLLFLRFEIFAKGKSAFILTRVAFVDLC